MTPKKNKNDTSGSLDDDEKTYKGNGSKSKGPDDNYLKNLLKFSSEKNKDQDKKKRLSDLDEGNQKDDRDKIVNDIKEHFDEKMDQLLKKINEKDGTKEKNNKNNAVEKKNDHKDTTEEKGSKNEFIKKGKKKEDGELSENYFNGKEIVKRFKNIINKKLHKLKKDVVKEIKKSKKATKPDFTDKNNKIELLLKQLRGKKSLEGNIDIANAI